MRLGSAAYYLDFILYPLMIAGLAAFASWRASPLEIATALGAFALGLGIWSLVEYILHRFVLHRLPYVREMHDSHHDDQKALIGAPTWLSLAVFACLVYLPLQLAAPLLAGGLTAGLMAGYVWYFSVHHVIHHGGFGHGAYAARLKRRHMLHHHFDDAGNFGVTSGVWDRLLGTDIEVPRTPRARSGRGG